MTIFRIISSADCDEFVSLVVSFELLEEPGANVVIVNEKLAAKFKIGQPIIYKSRKKRKPDIVQVNGVDMQLLELIEQPEYRVIDPTAFADDGSTVWTFNDSVGLQFVKSVITMKVGWL